MKLEYKDIEEVKQKTFHPFKIEFLIEDESELLDLWARFNFCNRDVNKELNELGYQSLSNTFDDMTKWKFIDNLLKNKPYMK